MALTIGIVYVLAAVFDWDFILRLSLWKLAAPDDDQVSRVGTAIIGGMLIFVGGYLLLF